MRLTEKDDRGRYYTVEEKILIANEPVNPTTTWITNNENRRYGSPINKLGKLEDLEEQLGCPLEVLGKALKNGIYRYNKNYEPNFRKEKVLYLGNNNGRYYINWLGCWTEYLDNYKKTWWLKADRSA